MSGREKEESGKRRLHIAEEDLAGVYQTRGGTHAPTVDDSAILTVRNPPPPGMTPVKLFVTLVIALPFAATLAYVGIDAYRTRSAPEPAPTVAPTPTPEPTRNPAVVELEKKVKALEGKLSAQAAHIREQDAEIKKQRATIEALANKPAPTPKPTEKPKPKPKTPFVLFEEKVKVLNLSGVDLDDPVDTPDIFDEVKKRGDLQKVIESLERILDHAGGEGIDDELIANVLRAKSYARDRLKKLK